ncbi:amidohydrolase [Sutterella sp.]|uniref:amidohydrolase n=1 Tax=Sutterella sp. TaxID=1981025 RepID=UPI0026E0A186|nr:amidohydrolase [Sutterella sp.]MDO5532089.1 amidohydrolase [Sutterella sp.]
MLSRPARFRRDLHRIPELDFDLPETTAYLTNVLSTLPCEVFSPDGHGVCAWFDAGKAESVAFRSDMDALPIREMNEVDFVSTHPGKMHACGHDGHMAMALELAHAVAEVRERLTKNVLIVFQPAEETTGGAQLIVKSGVFTEKNVKAIYGFHLWPDLPKGTVSSRPGPLLARSNEITADFEGKSTHIAKSEDGADALLAAARFVTAADRMLGQLRAEEGPWCTLKFGRLETGTVRNAIAARGHLEGSLRVFSDTAFEKAWGWLHDIADEITKNLGVKITLTRSEGYPPVINDEALFADALEKVPGLGTLEKPLLIAEDFAFYQKALPGLFMLLGTGTGIPLHSDRFNFDESVLEAGVEIYKKLLPLA